MLITRMLAHTTFKWFDQNMSVCFPVTLLAHFLSLHENVYDCWALSMSGLSTKHHEKLVCLLCTLSTV